MSHFAYVLNGVVDRVIVAEQEYIDSRVDKDQWVKTSYNTRGNIHYDSDGIPDGGVPLRGNYAAPGYTYDEINDVFIEPKPYPMATLDTATWTWTGIPTTIFD